MIYGTLWFISKPLMIYATIFHSSQFQGLCLTKNSSETLQNLPYFIHTKTWSCFFCFSFCATLCFSLMNALVYDDIDEGSCTKCKTEKATSGFHMYKIWQILKRFAGIFRQAQTLKLGGVIFLWHFYAFVWHFFSTSENLFWHLWHN